MNTLPKIVEVQTKRLLELAGLAKLDRDPRFQKALMAVAVGGDTKLASKLTQILHPLAIREQFCGVPFYTPEFEELCAGLDGEQLALLGVVFESDVPLLYPFNWLNQHAYVGGASGTGKTNALYSIALQTMRYCPVWVVDQSKQDYRHMLRLFPDLHVFDAKDFRFNPLEVPPGVKPEHHLTAFVTIFVKSNNLLDGSENMLTKACYQLYEERGILSGSQDFPTLLDIRDRIKSYKFRPYSREAGYQDSLLNRFGGYLIAAPELYGCSKGFAISELAERSLVLEVKGLSERHSRCLLNWVLFTLFLYRIGNRQRGNTLRNLVIIDEAKWAAPPGYNQNLGFVPLASVLAQSREAGIGIIIADQTADLDASVMVNSRLKMCMRLGSGADMERVRKTFALSREQEAHIAKLGTGQAIIRVPQIDPFLIRIPRVRLG